MSKDTKPAEVAPNWTTLAEMALKDNAALFQFGKDDVKLREKATEAKAKVDGAAHFRAKLLAAGQIAHENARVAKTISMKESFPEYWEKNCGADFPQRTYQLANVFTEIVLTGHITEEMFDGASENELCKLSGIHNAAEKEAVAAGDPSKKWENPYLAECLKAFHKPPVAGTGKVIAEQQRKMKTAKEAAENPAPAAPAEPANTLNLSTTEGLLKTIRMVGAECRSFADAPRVRELMEAMRLACNLLEDNPLVHAELVRAAEAAGTVPTKTKPADVTAVKTSVTDSGVRILMPA